MNRLKCFLAVLASVLIMGGCHSNLFDEVPPTGNGLLIKPCLVKEFSTELMLTDYLPQWEGADSLTSASNDVELIALKDDGSAFELKTASQSLLTTIEAWQAGRCLSFVVLRGRTQNDVWAYTSDCDADHLEVRFSQPAEEVVALWQNCRLPQSELHLSDDGLKLGVSIPKDARVMERSFIRVYAKTHDVRFNDVLVPLSKGGVVRDVQRLNRHDAQAQVLYSLMIDRFENGNPDNDRPLNRKDVRPEVDYQGGDLKGITHRIEQGFFDDLGVSTIWISPITQNPEDAWGYNQNPETRFSGYHGYWPIYTTKVDHRFGSEDELRELLRVAHEHHLNVILDYVANHLHINSPVLQAHPDWVTPLMLPDGRKNLGLWDEHRLTTWFDEHIPSLDLARDEVARPMVDSALHWVTAFDFDGFRHDACKHIPLNYWRLLTQKMRQRLGDKPLWQIGETYGSPELIGSYVKTGMIDAQFDFNIYHTALDVLTRGASLKRIVAVVDESQAAYGAHHTMGNITGNHDKARLISIAGGQLSPDEDHKAAGWLREIGVGDPIGYQKLGLIQALNMTIPGVPCIYQGDEYGEAGGNDPDNRRMMRFEEYNEKEMQQKALTQQLIRLRRSSMPLLYGDLKTLYADDDAWVFVRCYMGECTVVALNVSQHEKTIECGLGQELSGDHVLKSHFDQKLTLDARGMLQIELQPLAFDVWCNE